MKIAIPTRGNVVDDHFGHCEAYTVFSIDANQRIENIELVPSPAGCGCKSNIASVLKDKGVSVMLAGSMGNGALNVLNRHDIQVFRGCCGDITQVVDNYLKDMVSDSSVGCNHHDHHEGDHECSNH